MRRHQVLLALLCVIGLLGAACGSDDKPSSQGSSGGTQGGGAAVGLPKLEGTQGGTVVFAQEQEYFSYNALTIDGVSFANIQVLQLVQPGPYFLTGDLSFVLNAEMMKDVKLTSTDPQIVEWIIRPEAVWEDGAPIDCKDFYLTWLAQNGTATTGSDGDGDGAPDQRFSAAGTQGYEDISKVECSADGKTVTTTFSKKFVDYKGLFSGFVPAHIVESKTGVPDITKITKDSPEITKVAEFWNTGFDGFDPALALSGEWYRIADFTTGESLTLERNPKYYGDPAYLDKIIFKQVPDATQMPSALGNDDVNVISPQPNPDLVDAVAKLSGIKSELFEGTTWEHIDFNFANPILADLKVRQAIALCVDRDEVVQKLIQPLNPKASVLNNRLLSANQKGYVDHAKTSTIDYSKADPEKSKALLEEAGWKVGADGIREKDGKRLSLKVGRRDPNPRREQEVALFQSQCKPVGVELLDDPDPDFNSVRLGAGDYDIALFAWTSSPVLSAGQSIYTTGGGQNTQGLDDARLGSDFSVIGAEFDEQKRLDAVNVADQHLWEDMGSLPLFQFPEFVAYQDGIRNIIFNGTLGVTWNAFQWSR